MQGSLNQQGFFLLHDTLFTEILQRCRCLLQDKILRAEMAAWEKGERKRGFFFLTETLSNYFM